MAVTVGEIMNEAVYTATPKEKVASVLRDLLTLGVGGGPVVDDERRPLGVIALRDIASAPPDDSIDGYATKPALTVGRNELIHSAAVIMTETGYHRLIVVDGGDGGGGGGGRGEKVVGIVSSLDVLRGLIGLPARHPATFPHYDAKIGATWTDEATLDHQHLELAPDGPGVFVVIDGGADRPERIVWGESSENVRKRLAEYLNTPGTQPSLFTYWEKIGHLRFRSAKVEDPRSRRLALDRALHHHA